MFISILNGMGGRAENKQSRKEAMREMIEGIETGKYC
jgi:hypothetical protein